MLTTKTTAFAHFGVELKNVRWSWSGISEDQAVVAVVLWQDGVRGNGGLPTYSDTEELDAQWRERPGAKDRIDLFVLARDRLNGRFHAVIAKAADVHADPRQIVSCHPQVGIVWILDSFDQQTGAFTAHCERESQ